MSTKKNWTENAVDFGMYGISKCLNLLTKNNMEKLGFNEFVDELSKELLYNWDHCIDWITKLSGWWSYGINQKNMLFIAHLIYNRWYLVTDIEKIIEKMKENLEEFYEDWDKIDFYFYTKIRNKKVEIWAENN